MSDTVSAMIFRDVANTSLDVTKQNCHRNVGTLYREVLGEVVFCYNSTYTKIKQGQR